MADKPGFYIGKKIDSKSGKLLDEEVIYDPSDLTTHGFVTGMTGSGKTGLCIGLLEEAALEGIPAIMIDPKGDLTNLLLHFPNLLPSDFKPWIDPDVARRENKDLDTAAAETATMWKDGSGTVGVGTGKYPGIAKCGGFYHLYSWIKRRSGGQYSVVLPGSRNSMGRKPGNTS